MKYAIITSPLHSIKLFDHLNENNVKYTLVYINHKNDEGGVLCACEVDFDEADLLILKLKLNHDVLSEYTIDGDKEMTGYWGFTLAYLTQRYKEIIGE